MTGCPLRIEAGEYRSIQNRLLAELSRHEGMGWSTGVEQVRLGTYESGGGFSEELPLVLVSRVGNDVLSTAIALLADRPKREYDYLDLVTDGWEYSPTSMRVDVYDLGVAVINGTFEVRLPPEVALKDAIGTLKRMVWLRPDELGRVSPITGMFSKLSVATTEQFRKSVKATVADRTQPPWLNGPDPTDHSSPDYGRLLWLHPVSMLTTNDRSVVRSMARDLSPTFSKALAVPSGRFVSGIGSSAIVHLRRSVSTSTANEVDPTSLGVLRVIHGN